MNTYLRSAVRDAAPPIPPLQRLEPGAVVLQSVGSVADESHILVIGKDGLDLMCALLRAGAARVTHLCSHERPEADSASLAIVPNVPSVDWLASALPTIRRALHTNGRLALSAPAYPTIQQAVRRILVLNGFSAIRAHSVAGKYVFHAELPAFGLHRCA
jgi:hypothetical protein